MATSSYPVDLIIHVRQHQEALKQHQANPDPSNWKDPPFSLPADEVLQFLFEQAFQASLQTEEGRRPGFRIILTSEDGLKADAKRFAFDLKFRLIVFDEPRLLVASEITRIAPAAEFSRFLICVRETVSKAGHPLEIWGLLDVGENWLQFIRHETSGGRPPPNQLTVTSIAPGELALSSAGRIFVTLKDGAIIHPSHRALWNGPIIQHLEKDREAFYSDVLKTIGTNCWDKQYADEDYPKRVYIFFLERVLYNVRARGHGGTILVIPDHISRDDTRISDRVAIKYTCRYDHAWGALIASLRNHRHYFDYDASNSKKSNSDVWFACSSIQSRGEEIAESISDIAQSIAALTAVDGAVVLTTHFKVYGFGAEVICQSPTLKNVTIANSDTQIPLTNFGTRHRSAFRFCSTFEDAIAFVVSHDGGVKAVKRVGPNVVLWPDINNGAFGL